MKVSGSFRLTIFFLVLVVLGCGTDTSQPNDQFEVTVRLDEEPDRIHPMLSTASASTQIENHIFLPLVEYDPVNLELQPILAIGDPEIEKWGENGVQYTFEIRPEAKWSDGKPVTAQDYLFTLKAALNPHSQSTTWRGFLSQIDSVSIATDNLRRFTVYLGNANASSLTVSGNFGLYPRHHYDPDDLLGGYSLSELRRDSIGGPAAAFGQQFNSSTYSRDSVLGSGSYYLASWSSGQSMVLKKSDNWWTDEILPAYPDKITYVIVPDETTAITLLKSGEVDIMSRVSPTVFAELRENDGDLAFHTPAIMQYYYLALNNDKAVLKDKKVRRALAHLLDLDQLSKILMADLAQPIAGPIHPSKTYFNDKIRPLTYEPGKAVSLLEEAGWSDSNENGTVDKEIQGQVQELSLDILVTQKQLGQNIARILKENAAKVGIEINLVILEWGQILKKIANRDFDIVAMATRQAPGIDDLYQGWHTAGIGPDGRNVCGFGNEQSDQLIERLRETSDEEERTALFNEIQEIIYEEQPMIFLFAPTETIVCRKDLEMVISPRRPGYFETTARPVK